MKIFIPLLLLFCLAQESQAEMYRINHPVEIDSLLVAWLINRYVDPESAFILKDKSSQKESGVETGETTATGINTSDSPYRRTTRHTAFDAAVRKFSIQNNCIELLQRYNKILEITPWRKLEYPNAHNFEQMITPLLPDTPNDTTLSQPFSFIDQLCEQEFQIKVPKNQDSWKG